ncbi:MAG TPA: pyridoxamine 5'-phosphate oxidase family protein [Mycobacteriales bacterium]|nr:pyridoxamine 5'-phosphate oxidase family protein [Mycobacteriales bacterium]
MATVQIDGNERDGRGVPAKPLPQVQREVLDFLRAEAGFAQVVTVGRVGFPVGRTMGAPVNEDWSVDLVQRRVHRRLGQLRANPRLEITWVGPPAPGSVNDRPHVYDFGLLVPRVVFLRGVAEFRDADWTVDRYQRQTRINTARGYAQAPTRTPAEVARDLVGVHVRPVRVRAEGFGAGAQSFTWLVEDT